MCLWTQREGFLIITIIAEMKVVSPINPMFIQGHVEWDANNDIVTVLLPEFVPAK